MKDIHEMFEDYRKWLKSLKFDLTDPALKLKLRHIEGVAGFAYKIASEKNLPQNEINLATIIGLLHDTGRFPQWQYHHTFWDRTVYEDGKEHDHAEMGLELLFKRDGLKELFPDMTDNDREIVRLAIFNHNRLTIDSTNLSERQLLHCQIIRDADKLDNIVNVIVITPISELMDVQGFTEGDLWKSQLSDGVFRNLMSHELIDETKVKTPADHTVVWCGYLFDVNFPESMRVIKRADCVDRIINTVAGRFEDAKTNSQFEQIRAFLKSYVDEASA